MRIRGRVTGLIAGLSLVCVAAPATSAQGPEPEQLGILMSHKLFQLIDIRAEIAKGAAKSLSSSNFLDGIRPEWSPLLMDALNDEVAADQPQLETILGHAFAQAFTADELRAGATIMDAPEVQDAIRAAAAHQPAPATKNPPCNRECMGALNTAAGKSFFLKMGNLSTIMNGQMRQQMAVVIVPGLFIRFGEKARAYEKAHGNAH